MTTAKEFLKQFELGNTGKIDIEDAEEALIEFAKMHVEAALKEASENVKWSEQITMQGLQITINKGLILNAYPLSNIK